VVAAELAKALRRGQPRSRHRAGPAGRGQRRRHRNRPFRCWPMPRTAEATPAPALARPAMPRSSSRRRCTRDRGQFTLDPFTVDEPAGAARRNCPLRSQCTTSLTGRKLVLHPHHAHLHDAQLRQARRGCRKAAIDQPSPPQHTRPTRETGLFRSFLDGGAVGPPAPPSLATSHLSTSPPKTKW
jgi:hypothetical protein